MSLILGKDGFQKLMIGYPTVSDKYNVGPAVNAGPSDIYPGDAVFTLGEFDHGDYVGSADIAETTVDAFAGFAVATNVNVPKTYPAPEGPVPFGAGQAFGLMQSGYIAVKVKAADYDDIHEGEKIELDANGLVGISTGSGYDLEGYFTGVKEMHGAVAVAEIFIPFVKVTYMGE